MKLGNSSNWVHWLYAVRTGTSTSTNSLILLIGYLLHDLNTSPATAILIPLWTLNVSVLVWLYWEGLKINVGSSADPRRAWWEPLVLMMLLPLFSLWEAIGVMRGLLQFLRKSELKFKVIAKPV